MRCCTPAHDRAAFSLLTRIRQLVLSVGLGLFVFATLVPAADPGAAGQLKALGAMVSEKDGKVVAITFRDCSKLGAAEFKLIGGLTGLKKLTLYGKCNGLNDTTMPLLAGLTELEELGTDGIMVSDDGLKPMASLKNLRGIAFFHPSWGRKDFTGSGLAHLAALPQLRRLTFAGSTAGDDALAAVAKIQQLREFRTWHTSQTQAGNAHLTKLPNLTSLYIGQRLPSRGKASAPSFDDSTLTTIAEMKALESLTLTEARLSGPALVKLKALPRLRQVTIRQVDISPEAVKELQAALPKVKVVWTPLPEKEREELLTRKLRLP